MLEIDTTNFRGQANMPETKVKTDADSAECDNSNPVFQMVKFNYLYKKIAIHCTVKELFEEYQQFCRDQSFRVPTPNEKNKAFIPKLRDVGISYYSSHGKTRYKVSVEDIEKITNQHKWKNVHDADEMDDLEMGEEEYDCLNYSEPDHTRLIIHSRKLYYN